MTLPLTKGKFAIIDEDDFPRISQYRWFAVCPGGIWYAIANVNINGKHTTMRMHRYLLNASLDQTIDHVNHDGLDNRRSNLRFVTRNQNMQNRRRKIDKEFKGVNKVLRASGLPCWRAYIFKDHKRRHLGYFNTPEEAAKAYNRAAQELFGSFAYLNKVAA